MLAVTMLFSVFSPITAIAGQCDPIQESTQNESTTERGEYVIALEENMAALVSDPGEASKITKGTDTVIYETDLSKEELLQLKQSGEAVVEENFFLYGANEMRSRSARSKALCRTGRMHRNPIEKGRTGITA